MKQRLGIAIALCGDPDFLVLDEPTNGLDPQGIVEMRELILQLNRERQITVLISSHILDELAKLATHYGFLDGGRLVRQVTAQEVEAACRKCLRATVTDAHALCLVLDQLGLPYAVAGDNQVDIYQQVERHPAGGGPEPEGLPAPLPQGAGREPGELLYQPGGG